MTERKWRSIWDDPYDWHDDVSRIELRKDDGPVVLVTGGWLDEATTEDGDAYPVLEGMKDAYGKRVDFYSFDWWRVAE